MIAKELAEIKSEQSVIASRYVTVECMRSNVTETPAHTAYASALTHFDTSSQYNITTPYDGIVTVLTPQPYINPPFKNTHLVPPPFLPAAINNPTIPGSNITFNRPQFLVTMCARESYTLNTLPVFETRPNNYPRVISTPLKGCEGSSSEMSGMTQEMIR